MAEKQAGETVLIVAIPAAEPLVGAWRTRYDTRGVPAHVTVLYPFVDQRLIDDGVLGELAEIFARHRAFEMRLERCARFPGAGGGRGVLYLAPEFDEIEADLSPRLPVAARVSEVQLLALNGRRFTHQRSFPLAGQGSHRGPGNLSFANRTLIG